MLLKASGPVIMIHRVVTSYLPFQANALGLLRYIRLTARDVL